MLCGVLFFVLLTSAHGECDLQTMGMSELKELVNLLAVRSPFSLLRLMEQLRLEPPIVGVLCLSWLGGNGKPRRGRSFSPWGWIGWERAWFYNKGIHITTKDGSRAIFCTWIEKQAERTEKVFDGIEIPLPSYSEPASQESIFPFHPPVLNDIEGALPSYSEPDSDKSIFPLQPAKVMHGINRPLVPSYAVPPPAVFPLPLRPPTGATVRVLTGPGDLLEVPVAVSPLMQLAEVLRQAGFSFGQGTEDCIRLSRTEHARVNESFGWKVSVADRHGEVLYDDLCLPNEKEVIVKPGTVISLSYIPLPSLDSLIGASSNQEDVN